MARDVRWFTREEEEEEEEEEGAFSRVDAESADAARARFYL